MREKDCTVDRYSMIHTFGEVTKLTVKLIPHSIIPENVRDAMCEAMSDRFLPWKEGIRTRGAFFQHEVGGNKREAMIEVDKIYEDWLESIGVEKGETILQEWDW